MVAYPLAYHFVEDMPRQKTGVKCFALVTFFLGILIFIEKPEDCEQCIESYIELVCVFIARLITAFYFALFFLYVTELYPLRARGMGFGIGSAVGAIGSSSAPVILGFLI